MTRSSRLPMPHADIDPAMRQAILDCQGGYRTWAQAVCRKPFDCLNEHACNFVASLARADARAAAAARAEQKAA